MYVIYTHYPIFPTVPAGPPQNVSGIPISSTAILLSWRAPLFEDRNGVIRHYIVNVTELETLNEFSQVTTHLEIVLSTLHPHYTYECAVYAVTVGPGPGSAANITTLEEGILHYGRAEHKLYFSFYPMFLFLQPQVAIPRMLL